jgi:uncharacterized protein
MNSYSIEGRVQSLMYAVYGWMSVALIITAITAYYLALTPAFIMTLMKSPMLLILIFVVQIGLVIGLTAFLARMSLTTAIVMFTLYAVSVGLTLSSIFLVYTQASIATTFFVTAGMFAGMSLYGYLTKADLTTVGSISVMILWGLIISMLVNWFVQSPMFDLIISGIGVIVFALLTAYDTQKIKQIGQHMIASEQVMGKVAVIGALTLYLDFINLFLFLLRFLGNRRED